MQIAEAYVTLRTKSDQAKGEAKRAVDDIGKMKPKDIEVDANTKPASDELGKLEQTSKTKGKAIASNLARLFTAGIFVDQVGKAISAASNLEQAVGGTKAVFQEASGIIDAYAENSAEKLGLSERAFRENTTLMGGALKRLGFDVDDAAAKSIELTERAADLAATYGGTTTEAVQALGATLRGEYDSAERFNVGLSAARVEAKALELGLVDVEGKATAAGKTQATLALIMEDSADAMGQNAREAGTAAGQTERLKAKFEDMQAEIGSNLLPVFSRVVSMLSTVAEFFGDLPGPVQTAIVAMAGIAIVAGPIKNVVTSFTGLTAAIKKVGPQALATGGIVAAAAGIYLLYNARKNEAEQATREFVDALKAEQQGQKDAVVAAIAAKLATEDVATAASAAGLQNKDLARFIRGESVPAVQELVDAASATKDNLFFGDNSTTRLIEVADNLGITTDQAKALVDTLKTSRSAYSDAEAQLALLGDVSTDLGVSLDGTTAATEESGAAATGAKGGWDGIKAVFGEAGDAVEDTGEQLDKARESIVETGRYAQILADDQLASLEGSADDAATAAEGLADALGLVFGDAVDLQGAADQLRANIDDLAQSLKDNGKTLDVNTEKGRANRAQLRENVSGIQDYIRKLVESGASNDQAGREYGMMRDQLIKQATQFGLTEDQAADYINQLGLTPDSITTAINLAGVEPAREAIRKHIERVGAIPADKLTTIKALADRGDIDAVERALERLTRERHTYIRIHQTSTGGGSTSSNIIPTAEGGFFRGGSDGGQLRTLAEIPGARGDEAVLPLGNPGRLRQLVNMPEVRDRLSAALGESQGGGVAVMAQQTAGVSVGTVNVGTREDLSALDEHLSALLWRVRVGG